MARRVLLLLCVLGLAAVASATKIQTSDPTCTGTPIFDGDTISFTVQDGGGVFSFCNETSSNWTNLLVALSTTIPVGQIDCETTNFKSCQLYTTDQPNAVYAFFSGVCENVAACTKYTGVPIGGELTIDMNCTGDTCAPGSPFFPPDWNPGTGGTVYTDVPTDGNGNPKQFPPVPEPASLVLVGTGLAAGIVKRWR